MLLGNSAGRNQKSLVRCAQSDLNPIWLWLRTALLRYQPPYLFDRSGTKVIASTTELSRLCRAPPAMLQQFNDAAVRLGWQAPEHIIDVCPWVVPVHARSLECCPTLEAVVQRLCSGRSVGHLAPCRRSRHPGRNERARQRGYRRNRRPPPSCFLRPRWHIWPPAPAPAARWWGCGSGVFGGLG